MEYDRYGGGRTDLDGIGRGALSAMRYRDEVLRPIARLFAGAVGLNFILMPDNVRAHTTRAVIAYMHQEGRN